MRLPSRLAYIAAAKIASISACSAGLGLVTPQASFIALAASAGMSSRRAPRALRLGGMSTSALSRRMAAMTAGRFHHSSAK